MKRHLILALLLFSIAPLAFAEGDVTIGSFETFRSEILDEERTLMVHLPRGYDTSTADYPVLYLLDPRTRFHHTTGTVAALARLDHVPAMIVVGIVNTRRTRDLTPPWTDEASIAEEEGRDELVAAGGGADDFLRFLGEELVPHIEQKYRTAPFKMLVGHSFGGLFAVHAFHSQPDLFDATLAISPSLWWDVGRSVDQLQELFKAKPELKSRLYLTLADEGGDMVEQFRRAQTLLRYQAPDGLDWHAEVLDGEDHSTIPMPSVYSALRFFFPRWIVPAVILEQGLPAVEEHYASLSEDYGYEITASEATINMLGYRTLASDKVEAAIDIFKANVERFPDSANVYDSLGEAVEAAGRLEEALKLYEKAIALAREGGHDSNASFYEEHRDAVREKLEADAGDDS